MNYQNGTGSLCVSEIPASPIQSTLTQTDLTLNYFGGGMAIIGAIGFGFAYPLKRSDGL